MAKKKSTLKKSKDTSTVKGTNPLAPSDEEDEWKVRNAYEDIVRGHSHMQDEGLMGKVRKYAEKKKREITSLDDIIKYKNAKYGAGSEAHDNNDEDDNA